MDSKVLQFKNKKLAERLEQRQACEDELRERIEKLEKRQATDDATLLIVNRYWAQVNARRSPCWEGTEAFITSLVLSSFSWMRLWKPFSDVMSARGSCPRELRHLGARRGSLVMGSLGQTQGPQI